MSNFTDPLVLIHIDGNLWQTEREFSYHVGFEDSTDVITVPKGFLTDLASVPWPASMLIPKSGRYNQSAVLHDALYSWQGEITPPYNMKKRTRADCDYIFKEAMKNLGVNWFIRGTMYNSVRIFGGFVWNKKSMRIKYMKSLLFILFLFVSGCGFYRTTDISTCGQGDADIRYQSNTTFYLFQ